MGCEIGAEETGDPLAGRDIHLIQGELDSLAGVGLMRAELQERHDSPEPEAMLNVRVHELGDVVAGILEFGQVGGSSPPAPGELAGGSRASPAPAGSRGSLSCGSGEREDSEFMAVPLRAEG